jgi:cytochrome P450
MLSQALTSAYSASLRFHPQKLLNKQISPILQTLHLITDPPKFLDNCAAKYGDTFTVRVLGINSPPVVFLSHPQAINECFSIPAKELDFQKATHVFKPLFGEKSIVLQADSQHNRQRQLLMPTFHGDRMKSYGEQICQITKQATANWFDTISIQRVMPDITLQIILQIVFGLHPGTRYQQLRKLLTSLLEDITKPWYSSLFFFPPLQRDFGALSPWGNYLKRRQEIDELIYAEINERRRETETRIDVLSLLMSSCDANGEQMTNQELRDQLISLLLLGYETTAGVLSWLFYLIHAHPKVKNKLMQELNSLGNTPTPEAIIQLPYLNAVCQETLRIHPIALICTPRMVKNSVTITGKEYTSGSILIPCIYLAHRRQETYPNPEKFIPERFINQKFSSYEYLPFGGGYRGCIGAAFSLYEMKLILATILLRFNLELANNRPVKPVRRGITIVPSGGVFIRKAS